MAGLGLDIAPRPRPGARVTWRQMSLLAIIFTRCLSSFPFMLQENPVLTLGRAASFLGLCPYDWSREDLDPVLVTGYKGPAKEGGGLDEEIERELRAFYRPFNARLYEVLGRNLGWEKEDRNASMEGTGRRKDVRLANT